MDFSIKQWQIFSYLILMSNTGYGFGVKWSFWVEIHTLSEMFFPWEILSSLSFGNRLFSEQSKKFPEGSEGAFYGAFVPNIGI